MPIDTPLIHRRLVAGSDQKEARLSLKHYVVVVLVVNLDWQLDQAETCISIAFSYGDNEGRVRSDCDVT